MLFMYTLGLASIFPFWNQTSHMNKYRLSLGWEDPLEKGIATHFSILAWRIPWREELGGLPSMGLHRVGQYCRDLASAAASA